MPPQSTTTSHSTSPRSVRTPTTRRPCGPATVLNPHTRVLLDDPHPGGARAGRQRGSTAGRDRSGRRSACTPRPAPRPSLISGNSSRASVRGDRAPAAARRAAPSRAGGGSPPAAPARTPAAATPTPSSPGRAPPPPAPGTARPSSTFIRVSAGSERSWPTSPAEWNVEPLVSSARSTSRTSRLAPPGQVVGHARAAHPATDDHDPGTVRQLGHTVTLRLHGVPLGEAAAPLQSPSLVSGERHRDDRARRGFRRGARRAVPEADSEAELEGSLFDPQPRC